MKIEVDANLQLRLFEEKDIEPLYNLTEKNQDHLIEWGRWIKRLKTLNFTQKFIEQNRRAYQNFISAPFDKSQHSGFQLGIFEGKKPELSGMIGYQGIHLINRICSIGYWISYDKEGKGLVTKSCKALIDYSFSVFNFNRIEIQCSAENRRSRAIPERLNFTREARLAEFEWKDHQQAFADHILYRMLRRDYRRSSD